MQQQQCLLLTGEHGSLDRRTTQFGTESATFGGPPQCRSEGDRASPSVGNGQIILFRFGFGLDSDSLLEIN